jgi:hypothetical protein
MGKFNPLELWEVADKLKACDSQKALTLTITETPRTAIKAL